MVGSFRGSTVAPPGAWRRGCLRGLVIEWASLRRAAIEEDWDLAQRHREGPGGKGFAHFRLTLTDGEVVERSLEDVLWGLIFEPLRQDPEAFAAVAVETGTIAWPNGADIDPDVLIWGGAAPLDSAARPPKHLRLASRGVVAR
jgi:hypothetical protein